MNLNYKKITYSPYFLITLSNFSWFVFGLGKADSRLLKIDQKIMLLTSSKMHYFDLNTFEAAWNHHTPPIFYVFKLVFLFSDYLNIDFGFYVLHSCLLLLLNLLLFNVCYKLTTQKVISFLLSSAYIFDLSSTTIGGNVIFDNRTIGMVFQCLLLIFAYQILLTPTSKNIIFFSSTVFFQVLFLESYLVSCGLLFIYLLIKLEKKSKFIYYFFTSNVILLCITSLIFWRNSELKDTFYLNYIFHFDSIGLGPSNQVNLAELSKFGLFYHWDHNRVAYILTLLFIFSFFIIKDKIVIIKQSKEFFKLIIYFFSFEVIHLFLTGPRFPTYLQVILLLNYLVIFIFIFYLLNMFKFKTLVVNIIISAILVIEFFLMQFGDVVYTRTSLLDQSYLNAREAAVQDSNISKFLYSSGDPELVLSWIKYESWDDIYFKSNKLPATRMWWWFEMKYVESLYQWKNNRYYNTNLETIFLEDLKKERPVYAVLEVENIKAPEFFIEYIEKNYIYIDLIDGYNIYKLNE